MRRGAPHCGALQPCAQQKKKGRVRRAGGTSGGPGGGVTFDPHIILLTLSRVFHPPLKRNQKSPLMRRVVCSEIPIRVHVINLFGH